MQTLETERLILRQFEETDFDAVHAYASAIENVRFMDWGPNEASHTKAFIAFAIAKANETPCKNYQYAVVLKSSRLLIGGCNIAILNDDQAELGWILHRDYWKQGYGTEMGSCISTFAFKELGLHRLYARCDTENYGSYRVMERLGMRREGCFIEGRPASKNSGKKYTDEYLYAILRNEWRTLKDKSRLTLVFPAIEHKDAALAYRQEHFDNGEMLINGDAGLDRAESYEQWIEDITANLYQEVNGFVPATMYFAFDGDKLVGTIQIRHRLNARLMQTGGHIGYSIVPSERRRGYGSEMLRLALQKCKALGIEKALVTCDKINAASAGTILKNNGVLENEVTDGKGEIVQRYWVETR